MTNLSPEFCRKAKEARRAAGLSQSQLASELGCKQSALSMFESSCDGTKLNDEVINKLAKKFNLELPKEAVKSETFAASVSSVVRAVLAHTGYCPNPSCPSHHEYFVEEKRFLKPDRTATDPVGGKFCAVCGEILERKCPNCSAPVHEGAVCSLCGEPYIAV